MLRGCWYIAEIHDVAVHMDMTHGAEALETLLD